MWIGFRPRRIRLFIILPLFFLIPGHISAESATRVSGDQLPRGEFAVEASLPLPGSVGLFLSSVDDAEIFRSRGEIIYLHGTEFIPRLLPPSPVGRTSEHRRYTREHQQKNNNFAIEILMALDIPENLRDSLSNEEIDLRIFNVLHRISTLTGIHYFSASRGYKREFYLSSAIVDSADNTIVLPDPVFAAIRPSYRFVMKQVDASFGENLYEVAASPGTISIRNIDPMFYHIIQIADPGDLELQIRVHRAENYLLFSAFSSMKAPEIFGIQEKVRNSFYNRMVALYNWFTEEFSR